MADRIRVVSRVSPATAAAIFCLGVMIAAAVLAPSVVPQNPYQQNLADRLEPPSSSAPFGRDALGRDILSRVIYGSRISLMVGVVTVGISMTLGVLLGALAGTLGGMTEEIIMRIIDLLLAFPGLLLAIAFVGFLGPGIDHVILALCLTGWVSYARLTRGQILVLRETDFVLAARSLGAGPGRLIFRHLIPNLMTPLIVEATFGMAGAIVAEAGLSFLGLGVQPPTASWGVMLSEGRQFLMTAPHMTIAPGVAIMLLVMALNFLGDDLRDILDPRGRR